ncbi:MAG TPA: hypothetical protein VGM39_03090 [Kofleriaceae bacterium]
MSIIDFLANARGLAKGAKLVALSDLEHTAEENVVSLWSLAALRGRLIEVSGANGTAALTSVIDLVHEAQTQGEPVAWIVPTAVDERGGMFYPPDAADCGIDLAALVIVRTANPAAAGRAAERLMRSGAFGLVVIDFGANNNTVLPAGAMTNPDYPAAVAHALAVRPEPPAHPAPITSLSVSPTASLTLLEGGDPLAPSTSSHSSSHSSRSALPASHSPQLRVVRGEPSSADSSRVVHDEPPLRVFRGQPLPASDAPVVAGPKLPDAVLGRLVGLAQAHDVVVVCVTEKSSDAASLGSLISLRVEAERMPLLGGCEVKVRALKDKHRGPGWARDIGVSTYGD